MAKPKVYILAVRKEDDVVDLYQFITAKERESFLKYLKDISEPEDSDLDYATSEIVI